jgi:TRAP-type C4-dicarboxylate transport system permease small subunit
MNISRIQKWIEQISDTAGVAASIATGSMLVLIMVEVALRGLLGKSTLFSSDFVSLMLVFLTFFSLGYVLKNDRHIKVDLVITHVPKRIRKYLDLIADLISFLIVLYMIYWSWDMVKSSYQLKETSETVVAIALYVPKAFVPIGLMIFALQFVASFLGKILAPSPK